MTLPWVARSTLQQVADERDRLREREDRLLERIDQMSDQLIRLARVRNGRPETPIERKSQDQQPIPKGVMELIRGYEDRTTQFRLMKQARARHAAGDSWNEILEELEHQISQNMVR